VDGYLGELLCWEGQSAVLDISKSLVVGGQFLAHVYEGEIHEAASRGAAVLFGGGDQASPDSGALTLRIDCQ
jgi:hypothetical protein